MAGHASYMSRASGSLVPSGMGLAGARSFKATSADRRELGGDLAAN